MTQKHFIAISESIRTTLAAARAGTNMNCAASEAVGIITLAENLCDVFANENPRFDRARFLAACGIN